jgi:hypothetical protein
MKARKFDADFAAGKSIAKSLDLGKARRPGHEPKRVNVDFPSWMVAELDREAERLGVTRQPIIKVWLAERLDQSAFDVEETVPDSRSGRR